MDPLAAALPLIGLLLLLLAYWLWKKAQEAATDADLQKRFWDQSKYQRNYDQDRHTPLDAAKWFARERVKYLWLTAVSALLGLGSLGYGLYLLTQGKG